MSKKKSGRPHGHYCKICGEYKANEKFSGKGHAAHICKACSRLSAAEKAEAQTITRLTNFPTGRLIANDKAWLENRLHDHRPEVAELAREVYNIHFPYAERNARKKQLIINTLVFEIHTEVFDEYGDELPVNRRFTANRISRVLTMTDFDGDGAEQSMTLDGRRCPRSCAGPCIVWKFSCGRRTMIFLHPETASHHILIYCQSIGRTRMKKLTRIFQMKICRRGKSAGGCR